MRDIKKLLLCLSFCFYSFTNANINLENYKSVYLKTWEEHSSGSCLSAFEHILNQIFIDKISPEFATRIGLFESLGLHEHNRRLSNLSWEGYKKYVDRMKEYRVLLQEFPTDALTENEKLTKEVVLWQLDLLIEGERFFFHEYRVRQLLGTTQNLFTLLSSAHPIETSKDQKAFIERLVLIEDQFNQLINHMTLQREKGFFPPRFAIEKPLQGIRKLSELPFEKHPFYTRVIDKDKTLKNEVLEALKVNVYPAYHKLETFLENYLTALSEESGVWALPDGDAYYRHMLKTCTTLTICPEEVHELGLQEVARIEEEILNIVRNMEISTENLSTGMLFQMFSEDKNSYFPNNEEGRRLCIQKFDEILERSRALLGPFFSLKPAYRVEIIRMSPSEEIGGPSAYYRSPGKNGRPGTFVVNLSNMDHLPKFTMETLAIHEGEPGHHFQRAIEVDLDIHPLRKYYYNPAYAEGWALYAEKFAYEYGFFSSILDKIGHLQDEIWRAARLVVDTGIHAKRWSKSQAINYMCQVVGKPYEEMVAEVERYFVLPGQACSYKIGQLKILELRKEAMESLQDEFDIKTFHETIIKNGALPLSLLSCTKDVL